MKPVFLYGPPASGKTTLGKRLAEALKVPFVDLDAAVVEAAGKSIPEIFADQGEAVFRDLESKVLENLIAGDAPIIALGGGTLLRETNRALCESKGTVICLDAPSDEELSRRIHAAPGSRPLGNKAAERAAHYASFPNRLTSSLEASPSLVLVGNGIAPALVSHIPIVIDETVKKLYTPHLFPVPYSLFPIPSGEQHKAPATIQSIWHAFATWGLGRQDLVVAIGGGVTGDMTGFAAATWMRGMDWINVPTTLLAMVDASTGGKTGCDLPEGKNLAGAFHPPRLVIIDTDFLKTLSPKLISDGTAEMIKHTIISPGRGRSLVSPERSELRSRRYAGCAPLSPAAIAASLLVKVGIVREDPYETNGRRLLLNCGHTVAHAIEKLTDYAVSHGEAVAIGCVEEARLAVRLGLAKPDWPEELAARFAAANLPTALPAGLTFDALKPIMRGDKKRTGDSVTFALPIAWGDVRAIKVNLG